MKMAGNTIKLFQFNQKYCETIGIKSPKSNENRYTFDRIHLIFVILETIYAIALVSFLLYDAKSMGEYAITLHTLGCVVLASVAYFIAIWKTKDMLKFIEDCEAFIEKREKKTIQYKQLNVKIERMCEWFCYAFLVSILLMVLFPLLYTSVAYFILDLGSDSFYLYPPTKWPFDWRTPVGYLVAWFIESIGFFALGLVGVPFYSYLFGSCWLFIFIADDINEDLVSFNTDVIIVEKSTKTKKQTDDYEEELMNQFRAAVQIYTDAKDLVNEFNQIYTYSLFTFHTWTMLGLSSTLVTVQFLLWQDDWNRIEMITTVFILIWVLALNLLICEFGQRVTNQNEIFSDELGACNWHLLPIELRRLYLNFVLNTQQAVHIHCYGGILCSRETFKKISTKAFSYFTTLRQIR